MSVCCCCYRYSSIVSGMNPKFIQNCEGENELPELILALRKKLQGAQEGADPRYLRNIRTDDEFLAKILRTRAFNLERAYKSVLNYYKGIDRYYKDVASDSNSTSAYAMPVFNAKIFQRIPITASKGCSTTVLLNFHEWDSSKFTIYNLQQAAAFMFEDLAEKIETQLNGCSVILDFQGLSLQHLRQLTPAELRRIIYAAQDGLPIRIIGFHLINYPAIFWPLYNIAKLFMKEKMVKRIRFHTSLDSLYEYFHKEHLPISLGGPLDHNDLTEHNTMVNHFVAKNFHWKEYFTPKKM